MEKDKEQYKEEIVELTLTIKCDYECFICFFKNFIDMQS
jgi:hypothetical protein